MTAGRTPNPLSRLVAPDAVSASVMDAHDASVIHSRADLESAASTSATEDDAGGDRPEVQEAKLANVVSADLLEELMPAVELAIQFAEPWPAIYRPEIFRSALARLLSSLQTNPTLSHPLETGSIASAQHTAGATSVHRTSAPARDLSGTLPSDQIEPPIEKLARALGLGVETVERAVRANSDGRIAILGRPDGRGKHELQTRYTLTFLYIKEVAYGIRMVDIEALRSLCIEHACYDQGNFTGNYKKDVAAGLLREEGTKGSRVRRYMLSRRGLEEAADLLRTMAEQ
jgi:hypothetical protein